MPHHRGCCAHVETRTKSAPGAPPDGDAFAVHDDLVHVLDLIFLLQQHGLRVPQHGIIPPLLDLLRFAQRLPLLPLLLHLRMAPDY